MHTALPFPPGTFAGPAEPPPASDYGAAETTPSGLGQLPPSPASLPPPAFPLFPVVAVPGGGRGKRSWISSHATGHSTLPWRNSWLILPWTSVVCPSTLQTSSDSFVPKQQQPLRRSKTSVPYNAQPTLTCSSCLHQGQQMDEVGWGPQLPKTAGMAKGREVRCDTLTTRNLT